MTAFGGFVLLSAIVLTVVGAADAPDNAPTLRHQLGLSSTEREGYLLVRRLKCMDCHAYEVDGRMLGGSEDYPDAPYLNELDYEPDDLAYVLGDPKEALSEETQMPAFAHVPYEQRRAIGLFLKKLQQ
jgi:hypothetical protein